MPKSKVIKLEPLPIMEGQKYPAYNVEFEDGTKGMTKSKFVVGQEMEYIVENRPSKKDPSKTYTYITRPQVDTKPPYRKDFNGLIISTGTSYCVELFLREPFSSIKLDEIIAEIVYPMLAKVNEVVTEREKEFVSYAMRYAINIYEDDVQRGRFQQVKKLDGKDAVKELKLVVSIFYTILKNMLDVNKGISH